MVQLRDLQKQGKVPLPGKQIKRSGPTRPWQHQKKGTKGDDHELDNDIADSALGSLDSAQTNGEIVSTIDALSVDEHLSVVEAPHIAEIGVSDASSAKLARRSHLNEETVEFNESSTIGSILTKDDLALTAGHSFLKDEKAEGNVFAGKASRSNHSLALSSYAQSLLELSHKLGGDSALRYLALKDSCKGDGLLLSLSLANIAKLLSITDVSARRLINSLEENNFITVERESDPKMRTPRIYRFSDIHI